MNLRILNCLDTEEGSLGVLGLISGTEGDIVFLENDMLFGLFKRLEFSLSFEFVLINQSPAHSKMPAFLSVSRVSCTERALWHDIYCRFIFHGPTVWWLLVLLSAISLGCFSEISLTLFKSSNSLKPSGIFFFRLSDYLEKASVFHYPFGLIIILSVSCLQTMLCKYV